MAFLKNLNFIKTSVKYVGLYNKKAQTLERNLGQTSHCEDADDGFNKDYVLLGVWKESLEKKTI